MLRKLLLACALVLSACSPNANPPQHTDQTANFPGPRATGQAAVYYVYTGVHPALGVQILDVEAKFETPMVTDPKPVQGATIVYPDGSTQTSAADGSFDASQSAYASAHPEAIDGTDTTVVVRPPQGLDVSAVEAQVFTPSPSQEAGIESGELPEDSSSDAAVRPASLGPVAANCNPADYEQGTADNLFGYQTIDNMTVLDLAAQRTFKGHYQMAFIGRSGFCNAPARGSFLSTDTEWRTNEIGELTWILHMHLTHFVSHTTTGYEAVWVNPVNGDSSLQRRIVLACPYFYWPSQQQTLGCK